MKQITLEKLNEKIERMRREFEKLKEDLEFARRTEEAWERHDRGEFKTLELNEFLEEIKKW